MTCDRASWILIVAALAGGCREIETDGALSRVRGAGVLRWGADVQGGEPYAFEVAGKLTGFEVEIAEALARELGVRAEMVQNDWSTLVPSLERGTFDVIMNGLEVTPARARRIRFTRPYFIFSERLVAREGDSRVRSLNTLGDLRVGTLANTQAWEMLASAKRVPYEGVEEPFIDLAQGRIDAVLMDDIIVDRYGRKPGLVVVGDVAEGQYALGVRPADEDLWRALDQALGRLAQSGELRKILERWKLDGARQATLATAVAPPFDGVQIRRRLDARTIALFFEGAVVTIAISTAAMALAVLGGLLLAMARLPSPSRARRIAGGMATAYVELFRGTPVLLQLYVLYYGLAPVLALHPMVAAVIGLGMNYAAYEAEIYRAGIQAVPRGEIEAGLALGMSGPLTFRRVVLPQALRFSLPGMANDFIALLKDTSLVSVITVVELTKRMTIAAVDFGSWLVPGALCALLYFAMSYPLSRLARRLEAHLQGGST